MSEIRKIIHVDMDAFYASVEQRNHPEYRGKPVAVGGNKLRGVVAAASYEARKYGVHSAMPSALAIKKCPNLIFIKPKFNQYKEISDQIMGIFKSYTDLVEPMSLDEAYLDVTENKFNIPSATIIAKEIRKKIKAETRLTASAGVSFNKILAKVASDYDKPDGLFVIPPEKADDFIDKLPIKKIPGIGKATEKKMFELGIKTGGDIKIRSKYWLNRHFGKFGVYLYGLLRHQYDNPVQPTKIRKSIGAERTFERDLDDERQMIFALREIAEKVAERMERKNLMGKTLTLKIKYFDFEMNTRSRTTNHFINSTDEIFDAASELLFVPIKPIKPVRLLGVQLSNLNTEIREKSPKQLSFGFYLNKQVNSGRGAKEF